MAHWENNCKFSVNGHATHQVYPHPPIPLHDIILIHLIHFVTVGGEGGGGKSNERSYYNVTE